MELLKHARSGDWEEYEQLQEYRYSKDLEPLELTKEEELTVISRMKKIAKDFSIKIPNALKLVHLGYEEQEWERQDAIGSLTRPSPTDKKAWKQYEKFIELSVKLLMKYRGADGEWRSDRYDTVPTNSRSSMASMAAGEVSESYCVTWDSLSELNVALEEAHEKSPLFRNNCIVNMELDDYKCKLNDELKSRNLLMTLMGESKIIIYNKDADIVDTVTITTHSS